MLRGPSKFQEIDFFLFCIFRILTLSEIRKISLCVESSLFELFNTLLHCLFRNFCRYKSIPRRVEPTILGKLPRWNGFSNHKLPHQLSIDAISWPFYLWRTTSVKTKNLMNFFRYSVGESLFILEGDFQIFIFSNFYSFQ